MVDGLQGADWRIRWVGILALLRAVMHTLKNVDCKTDPNLEETEAREWALLRETRSGASVFWEFIYRDRTLALKEYDLRSGQNVTIFPGERSEYQYHMNAPSPYAGQDPRDVVDEAIQWLEAYIEAVEAGAR